MNKEKNKRGPRKSHKAGRVFFKEETVKGAHNHRLRRYLFRPIIGRKQANKCLFSSKFMEREQKKTSSFSKRVESLLKLRSLH